MIEAQDNSSIKQKLASKPENLTKIFEDLEKSGFEKKHLIHLLVKLNVHFVIHSL